MNKILFMIALALSFSVKASDVAQFECKKTNATTVQIWAKASGDWQKVFYPVIRKTSTEADQVLRTCIIWKDFYQIKGTSIFWIEKADGESIERVGLEKMVNRIMNGQTGYMTSKTPEGLFDVVAQLIVKKILFYDPSKIDPNSKQTFLSNLASSQVDCRQNTINGHPVMRLWGRTYGDWVQISDAIPFDDYPSRNTAVEECVKLKNHFRISFEGTHRLGAIIPMETDKEKRYLIRTIDDEAIENTGVAGASGNLWNGSAGDVTSEDPDELLEKVASLIISKIKINSNESADVKKIKSKYDEHHYW